MSNMVEVGESEIVEFKWKIKRGTDVKKKVHFYESFAYDGLDYSLYDCVYLYKEGVLEPYIGKIIKIWELPDKTKKVKILWLFRPSEILNWLGDDETLENELFLASGEGVGLANVNPLEAIAGKCNVVCTSKDSRNRQPSLEELQEADYIFHRTFDVGHCKILNKIDEKIAGIEVKFVFNRKLCPKPGNVLQPDPERAEGGWNKVLSSDKELLSKPNAKIEGKVNKIHVNTTLVEQKLKFTTDASALDNRPLKNAKADSSLPPSQEKGSDGLNINWDDTSSQHKTKSKGAKDSPRLENGPSKRLKPDDDVLKPSKGKLHKPRPGESPNDDFQCGDQLLEVTRRPIDDSSRWFKGPPWEERMRSAHKQGTLVLLQNLDPAYTSDEVEDIVRHGFEEYCTAKMIQKMAISSSHCGQAYVIFKTREVAEMVVRRLDKGCLMLPNGRPLVGSIGTPNFQEKHSSFAGHLSIDKVKFLMQRGEMKQAVSTSHCSQPNTIEYEMAMEWRLLKAREDRSWKKLYEMQEELLRKLKAGLKSK